MRCFSRQITAKLVKEHDAKMVVVACNTAAAAGLEGLSDSFGVPVLTVIEPGLRAAMRATATGRVGVIGTVGTVSSGAYQRAIANLDPSGDVDLTCAACPGFVEFVERGETDSDQVYVLAERLLAPIRAARVDTLLLGCTHYPFLARTISDVVGRDVVLVSSADETGVRAAGSLDRQQPRTVEGVTRFAHVDLVGRCGHLPHVGSATPRARDRRSPSLGSRRRLARIEGVTAPGRKPSHARISSRNG